MNTNTYRCGCGSILGYLPSGAKESCTACLQVRRREAIAKAGAREAKGRTRGPVYSVQNLDRASCAPRKDGRFLAPEHIEAAFSEAPASDMMDAFRYAVEAQKRTMQAWRDAAPVAVLDEAHPIPKRLFDPARFGARKSTARFGGRTPGQALERAAARNGLFATGVDLDQHARELKGLEREPGESDYSLRTRLLHAVQRRG